MKAIITVGLGWGDEGKGSIVDFLCRHYENSLVIRYSGAHQCGHNVHTPDGKHHCFAQFGSGTLAERSTILFDDVIIEPFALKKEAEHLESLGIKSPYKLLHVAEHCPVTTPFHKIVNRAIQKENKIGSCGLGVGMTRYTDMMGCSVYHTDSSYEIRVKLQRIRAILEDYYYEKCGYRTPLDFSEANIYKISENLLSSMIQIKTWKLSGPPPAETIIFEGAQGMALNEYTGYSYRENTWGNISPRNAVEWCEGDHVQYHILGITRTYVTRHGGTLPLESLNLPPDDGNPTNPYQGEIKFYKQNEDLFDKYYKQAGCHSLAINHKDQYFVRDFMHNYDISIIGCGKTHADKEFIKKLKFK